jgi:AAA ATPase domain
MIEKVRAGPGPLPSRPAQLRGRREELAEIRAALQALAAGRGGIRLVRGLPGASKSALLDAAEDLARPLGIKVARGSGLAATTTVPFGVILSALAAGEEPLVDPVRCGSLAGRPIRGSGCCRSFRTRCSGPRPAAR